MGQCRAQRTHQGGTGSRGGARRSRRGTRMMRARITGVGAYAPKRILSNADLEKMVETSDEWIVQRSGIHERRIADESEATSDLAVRAAQQANERANLAPKETVEARMHYAKMRGNEVFKVAVRLFVDCAERILSRNGFTSADVDLFVPHQANLRIIEAAAKRVALPMERVFVNVDRYGNTGAASVYVALEEAVAAGRLKRGDLVLVVAFGGGFSWGAALIRW